MGKNSLHDLLETSESKSFVRGLYNASESKEYCVILQRQLRQMDNNLKSIDVLIAAGLIEDAYTIFRKFLETFFQVGFVLEHPDAASSFVRHDKMLAIKVTGKNPGLVNAFIGEELEGYLEYGYIKSYLNPNREIARYNVRLLCFAANLHDYYDWYRETSNFVHNNLTQCKLDLPSLSASLDTMISACLGILHERMARYENDLT